MILEIMQISSGEKNHFLIFDQEQFCYQMEYNGGAGFPFSTPDGILQMKDMDGNVVYHAKYSYNQQLQDRSNYVNGFLGGTNNTNKYWVYTADGMPAGAFFEVHKSMEEARLCLEYQGRILTGFRKLNGREEFLSIYDKDVQVGQLSKKGFTYRRRDAFSVHFLDGYEELKPILAFFAVFYDYKYHNVSTDVPFGRDSNMFNLKQNGYDPSFIPNHFGPEEPARMQAFFNAAYHELCPYPVPDNIPVKRGIPRSGTKVTGNNDILKIVLIVAGIMIGLPLLIGGIIIVFAILLIIIKALF